MVIFLKVKLTEFTNKQDAGKDEKADSNTDPDSWGLGKGKNGVVLN